MLLNSILPYLGRVLRNLHLDLKSTWWQKNDPDSKMNQDPFYPMGKQKLLKELAIIIYSSSL